VSEGAVESRAEQSQFAKLSPGPGTPASEVAASQRSRFFAAMIQLVAERGYGKVTVQDLSGVAKVSTRAFYENFRGKEDCFVQTHELVVRRTAQRVIASQSGERNWRERLRLGFRAFIRELEREPQAARLALVDAYLDGPAARAQARKAELLFGSMLAESFGHDPDGPPVSSVVVEAMVTGIAEVGRRHILSGKRHAFPRIADELVEWTLACRERAHSLPTPLSIPLSSKRVMTGSQSGTSDRDLSLAAVTKLALSHGYAYLTVPRIRAAAGISQPRFFAEFKDVDYCLAAAREERLGEVFSNVGGRGVGSAKARAEIVVPVLCAQFADDPELARLCFSVDCVGPLCLAEEGELGPPAVDRVAEILYGAKVGQRSSVAVQAGAGMIWAMIGIRSLSKRWDALQRVTPLLAALA
jgi:AcrR family transcriptional regulator